MTFLQDEDGAVTVDWVVLTAALVLLPIAAAYAVGDGVGDMATEVADSLSAKE